MNVQDELTLWTGVVRYYLGRMSYAVSSACEMLCAEWPKLSPETRWMIQRDIEEAFGSDDKARARGEIAWLPLGHDCDRRSWETVRRLWEQPDPPVSRAEERRRVAQSPLHQGPGDCLKCGQRALACLCGHSG